MDNQESEETNENVLVNIITSINGILPRLQI